MSHHNLKRLSVVAAQNPDQAIATIDMFSHRCQAAEGYVPDDILLHFAAVALHEYDTKNGATNPLAPMNATHALDVGFETPFLSVNKGAIIFSEDRDVTGDIVVTVDGSHVVLPNGSTMSYTKFTNGRHSPYRGSGYRTYIYHNPKTIQAIYQDTSIRGRMFLACILAAHPYEVDTEQDPFIKAEVIVSRCATLLNMGFKSGAAGRTEAQEIIRDHYRTLKSGFRVTPDRLWGADRMIMVEDDTIAYDRAGLAPYLQIATRAMTALENVEPIIAFRAAAIENDGCASSGSFHQQISLMEIIRAIDEIILMTAPEHILKPGALKRARKLRSSE